MRNTRYNTTLLPGHATLGALHAINASIPQDCHHQQTEGPALP